MKTFTDSVNELRFIASHICKYSFMMLVAHSVHCCGEIIHTVDCKKFGYSGRGLPKYLCSCEMIIENAKRMYTMVHDNEYELLWKNQFAWSVIDDSGLYRLFCKIADKSNADDKGMYTVPSSSTTDQSSVNSASVGMDAISFVNAFNDDVCFLKKLPWKRLTDLRTGVDYVILDMRKVFTSLSEYRICAILYDTVANELGCFQIYLPTRYTNRFTDDEMSVVRRHSMKLTYYGKKDDGLTEDLKVSL